MKYNTTIVMATFEQYGIPQPLMEFKFASDVEFVGKDGRTRTRSWAFDFAWFNEKVALEVEGGIFIGGGHTRGSGFKKDMAKYNMAASRGWRVIRCQPKELLMLDTINLILACL